MLLKIRLKFQHGYSVAQIEHLVIARRRYEDEAISSTSLLNGTEQRIADNEYDELGQLKRKGVGNTVSLAALQEADYGYNIRGWLTHINDVADLTIGTDPIDLFSFKINYSDPVQSHFPSGLEIESLYNGNIAETFWRTASDNILRGYGYKYDELNRLVDARYQKPGAAVPTPGNYDEFLTYDLNGNILSLNRFSGQDTPAGAQHTDELAYAYFDHSNKLKKVTDATGMNTPGFIDGNIIGDDYTYDANGNMLTDRNKGITATPITYNHLNLSIKVQWTSTKKIEYLYNAAGVKVQKKVTDGSNIKTTDYLDGFQYNQNLLEFFPHAEGYVKVTAMGINPNNPNYAYNYVFNYADHLGNVRVSYTKDPQTGNLKILDESHYYPFGLKHQQYAVLGLVESANQVIIAPIANNPFKYAFNNKELQDELNLNLYDFGARNYDPALGRWFNLDRLSEKYEAISSYGYVANNPIRYIDINGEWIYIKDGEKEYRYENGQTQHQVNGEWQTIDETVDLSKYVVGVVAGLNDLERSGNTGFAVVNYFSNDENNVYFEGTGINQYKRRSNSVEVDKRFKGSDVPVEGNKLERSPFYVTIGHELAHRINYDINGSSGIGPWLTVDGKIINKSEKYATHIENMIRAEAGLPLRTHYGVDYSSKSQGYEPSQIIDSNGNSLFYNQPVPTSLYNFKEGVIIQMRQENVKYNYRKLNVNPLNNSFR